MTSADFQIVSELTRKFIFNLAEWKCWEINQNSIRFGENLLYNLKWQHEMQFNLLCRDCYSHFQHETINRMILTKMNAFFCPFCTSSSFSFSFQMALKQRF